MKINSIKKVPSVLFIYDPALCCNSGVCGVDADEVLIQFSADLDWLKKQGIEVKRFNLAQEPMEFASNTQVKTFLEEKGVDQLPVCLVDHEVKAFGNYPSRQELASWFDLKLTDDDKEEAASSCCNTSSKCC